MPKGYKITSHEDFVRVFWSKVSIRGENECWEWNGWMAANGYGGVDYRGKRYKAHRMSYMLSKGEIQQGLFVCHTCDNRKCVNPNHLWLGTREENMQDCIRKRRGAWDTKPERMPHGERHWMNLYPERRFYGTKNVNCRLNEELVVEIRSLYGHSGNTIPSLAKKFNVSKATIHRVIKGKVWSWVK